MKNHSFSQERTRIWRTMLVCYQYRISGLPNYIYIKSLSFRAAPCFGISLLCFALSGLSLVLICCGYSHHRSHPREYCRKTYVFSFVLLIFVSVAIIVGSVMLYNGAHEFTKVTGRASSFVMRQAKNTIYMLTQVSETVAASRSIAATHLFSGFEVLKSIDSIRPLLDFTASSLAGKTNQYSHYISDLVLLVRLSLNILATLTLLLMVAGSLCAILGRRIIVFIAVTDTYIAINQWVQIPTAHTTLDDLLPCIDNATGYQTLLGTKQISFQLVNTIKRVITNVSNANIPSAARHPRFYNQAGPLLPLLRNPYNADMSNHECAAGEVHFRKVRKRYVCKI